MKPSRRGQAANRREVSYLMFRSWVTRWRRQRLSVGEANGSVGSWPWALRKPSSATQRLISIGISMLELYCSITNRLDTALQYEVVYRSSAQIRSVIFGQFQYTPASYSEANLWAIFGHPARSW